MIGLSDFIVSGVDQLRNCRKLGKHHWYVHETEPSSKFRIALRGLSHSVIIL